MSDLTREQQARYVRTRQLTTTTSIQQTLVELEQAAANPDLSDELRDLAATASTTIRYLQHRVETERALSNAERGQRLHGELDLAASFAAEGQTYAELGDDGKIVIVEPTDEPIDASEDDHEQQLPE